MRRRPQAKIAANGQLDRALGRLLLLTENYPQLRSSDQFMRLQDELSGTENRISVARKRYNDALQDYNTFILQFPNSIWAGMAGFQKNDAYFDSQPGGADGAQREVLAPRTRAQQKAIPPAGWPFAVVSSREICSTGLLERSDGAGFVVVDVEDGVELGQLQHVLHLLGQAQQLQGGALILGGGVGAYQFAQPRAIDVVHVAQIEQDVLLSLADQVANGLAQLHTALAQGDPPAEVQNGTPSTSREAIVSATEIPPFRSLRL